MTTAGELREFLDYENGVDNDDVAYIDEGGLTLCIRSKHALMRFEVGGDPEADDAPPSADVDEFTDSALPDTEDRED